MAVYDASGTELTAVADRFSVPCAGVWAKDKTSTSLMENVKVLNYNGFNGMAISDGVLFQARDGSTYWQLDADDFNVIRSALSTVVSHGNAMSFTSLYDSPNDPYPLLLSFSTGSVVALIKVTNSSGILYKTFALKSGTVFEGTSVRFQSLCCDSSSNILYTIGYTLNSDLDDKNGQNRIIIASWNLNNLTENQDGTYTPELLSYKESSWIRVLQDSVYHNGKLYVSSGYKDTTNQYISVFDTQGNPIVTKKMPLTEEMEGIEYVVDNDGEYILCSQNYYDGASTARLTYYKIWLP